MNNYKILIVDDHIETIQTIIRFLEESHPEYRLYQATEAKTALRLMESIPFDLVISDWEMPDVNGIDLIKIIKSNSKTAHIPVIIASGIMLSSKDLKVALDAGAYDYVRIPVDPVELSARVNSALRLLSYHHKEIEKKNIELVEKTMLLIKNNEFNLEIEKKLKKLMKSFDGNRTAKALIDKIIKDIDTKLRQDSWQQFEIAFNSVHSDFTKDLIAQYPNLTPAEVRLSIFIKLGMNIKDTASVLYQTPESLKVARSRLRKKLSINSDINLQNYLITI